MLQRLNLVYIVVRYSVGEVGLAKMSKINYAKIFNVSSQKMVNANGKKIIKIFLFLCFISTHAAFF